LTFKPIGVDQAAQRILQLLESIQTAKAQWNWPLLFTSIIT
jgi:hypothetical protein